MDDFIYFCRLQLDTGDYDAHIPFLKELSDGMHYEEAARLGFLYMAYYNEASAYLAHTNFRGYPHLDLPTEVQRRNLYSKEQMQMHLAHLEDYGPWEVQLRACGSWEDLLSKIADIYGNGRWAAYTTSELLMHLLCLPVEPTSFEILMSSGPRQGLGWLGYCETEESAHEVHNIMQVELGVDIHLSQMESLLCDWAGMCKGTFYAGRNIDRQQGRIVKVARLVRDRGGDHSVLQRLLEVRRAVFPADSLGENNGWCGIDKARLKVYKETRRVLAPWEER
jgi:hypothetical protein